MMLVAGEYDIIVIGAGHAGCEAALAGARMGLRILVLTTNLENIALMPCNPSVGGPAKGHLVREVDSLGGQMGLIADATAIQMRMLNTGKGPAVQSLRAQVDKKAYQVEMRRVLEFQPKLDLKQALAEEILTEGGRASGVRTRNGIVYRAPAVVLAAGTYLEGRTIVGETMTAAGPSGQLPASGLSQSLIKLELSLRRFKTGTPPRVDGRTVDSSKMVEQPGDDYPWRFSFLNEPKPRKQMSCWLTYTTEESHRIIRENLHRAPMYSGAIKGVGPRYCPSIEDKVVRFAEKPGHQIFLEPEGWNTNEMYVAGLSTSLPEDVQLELLRSVPGLEKVEIMRPGYAIEYDCLDPTQLTPGLEVRSVPGLFAAGQANGSSGYEEAAAQGLMAGINAALSLHGAERLYLRRDEAYIGVLIDDLVTKGAIEPYRMMTARAEYRLLLRQDNADRRLTPAGRRIGLVDDFRWARYSAKAEAIREESERLAQTPVRPSPEVNAVLHGAGSVELVQSVTAESLLRRPEIGYEELVLAGAGRAELPFDVRREVEVDLKYRGYIAKQELQVERFRRLEERELPERINYGTIAALSSEARQKLSLIRPRTLGQASRISGVSPADISVLMIYLDGRKG